MGIQLLETNSLKKETLECLVYNISRHNLAECWYIFKKLKPEEMKLYDHHIKQIKKKIKNNEQLKD